MVVANVGDSRGVMCDSRGNAIPLSFDHKPQQVRERKRIHEAGGFIAYKGVWRVAGILATSRALGDYPLKEGNLVIADPDILTFNLADHKSVREGLSTRVALLIMFTSFQAHVPDLCVGRTVGHVQQRGGGVVHQGPTHGTPLWSQEHYAAVVLARVHG